MPLDMDSGAALIPGAALSTKTRHVRVLRAFMAGGLVIDAGQELALPAVFAAEMVGAGKAQHIAGPVHAEPAAGPAAPTTAKPAKPAKEKTDAR